MGQWLRWFLELLGIRSSKAARSEDDSVSAEEWEARLFALKVDAKESSDKLKQYDKVCGQLRRQLEDAKAVGEKDFILDGYQHEYDEATATFESMRRLVNGIRVDISTLGGLVRMRKEGLATGLPVEAEQYHREARKQYTAIQIQREQLREIEISQAVLRETRDTAFNGRSVSPEEFEVDLGEVPKDKASESE